MKGTNKVHIILAEDHKIVRNGLKALLELESDFTVVDEAEDGLEAIEMVKLHLPEIIIMDIAMPKLNGIEASREILKFNHKIKILVLSAYADDGYIEKLTSIGVSGFLIKQCAPQVLIQAIREIMKGKTFFSPGIAERADHLGKHLNNLSPREVQVLQSIAEGKANKQVAQDLNISIKTVEKHRQKIMDKLCIHDTAGLTRYAISEGIIENSSQNIQPKLI